MSTKLYIYKRSYGVYYGVTFPSANLSIDIPSDSFYIYAIKGNAHRQSTFNN